VRNFGYHWWLSENKVYSSSQSVGNKSSASENTPNNGKHSSPRENYQCECSKEIFKKSPKNSLICVYPKPSEEHLENAKPEDVKI
jgi:hypothetical protein